VDTPSEEGHVVVSPSEVNSFVVGSDDETFFYAIDIPGDPPGGVYPDGKVYKSTNWAVTWEDEITRALEDEGATLPAWDIAVAPDDPDLVAVVTDGRQEVYVSDDGGETWADTGVSDAADWDANLLIADIAISAEYGDGYRDIAIGTRNPDGSANGDVWVMKSVIFSEWKSQELDIDVSSVRFSPGYDSDRAVVVIGSDCDGTYLCTGIHYTDLNTTDWSVTDPEKVEIRGVGIGSPGESEIIFSDLALPSDYSAEEEETDRRVVYAGYSSNTTADDVYRIDDAEVNRLDVKDGNKVSIASIAYQGTCSGGKLLVGEVLSAVNSANALIHFCSDPEEDPPYWEEPSKPPTGGAVSGCANAQVAWGSDGEVAYCGTSSNNVTSAADWADMTFGPWEGAEFDESAFSKSEDDCDVWNQLSLIDTEMSHLCNYALSEGTEDSETLYHLYLASVGRGFDSIWQSEGKTLEELGEVWQRMLCFDSGTDDIILEAAPEESEEEAIFLAAVGSDYARYSLDGGQTWKWFWRPCPSVTDLTVVSDKVLYVLDDNLINKGTWNKDRGLWEWDRDIETGLLHGYSIASSGEDFVFVGDNGDEGKIAYSTDGGDTVELTEAVPEPGKMVVIPDEKFNKNRLIYAASDDTLGGIYRWAIEGSTSWRELNPPHLGFCGLAQRWGALYGAYADREGVARTLIPHLETVEEDDWDSLTVGLTSGVTFRAGTLRAIGEKDVELWAIDSRSYDFLNNEGCLWVYSDTFVLRAPWPTSPAIGESLPCDPCTCQARTFCFRWRRLSLAKQYDIWVALDERFNYVIIKAENITPDDLCDPAWCLPSGQFSLGCGSTYYWKVRSCATTEHERVHSRWSPPIRFAVKTCFTAGGMHVEPMLVAPEIGSTGVSRSPGFSWRGFPHTTKYEFVLARDADLTQVVVKEKVPASAYIYSGQLDWGTTYFWQVRAIEPVPSEPSVVGIFTVISQPTAASASPVTPSTPLSSTPFWIWPVIGVLSLLVIVVIVLCLVKR